MKKLFVLLISIMFIGCMGNGFQMGGLTPPDQSVCAQEGYENSWICKATAQTGLTPEDLNGIILDSVALIIIIGDMTSEELQPIRDFLDDVDGYTNTSGMSWNMLLGLIEEDSAKANAIASILNRRIKIFASDELISSVDLDMIKYHLKEMRSLLGN